ncbi:Cof-type HAD-IIB family hydrolase [Salirhabdus salicampi]|uniref:Cof-type HAD-IIB family hydrolase n=1 Tax=Salirhabdus salicampi TaxID=476102 RepID=UPI0020C4CD58|nr:Cof-type HAD-IIB family hydrolase [Salirhabdus salicampi]MCP8615559.1 Cof-type HAD-IIB family hydrolase [Salirhabdus salicampi]
MKKHLIALDLDGTLLTDEKTISQKSKQVLSEAVKKGHIVVISTGRPHRASIQYYKELQLDTPMVNVNGAVVHHPYEPKWDIVHSPMSIRTAKEIIHTCYELGVKNIMAEIQDDVYLDQLDHEIMELFHLGDGKHPIKVGSLENHLQEDPTTILIYPHENQVPLIRASLDEKHAEMIEHRNWGVPWNIIEIVRAGINKAVGLQKIAHYYDIPKEQIIAFGDEDNDFEMIEYAGVGVAMENGINELKQRANYITRSNEEDGVASFLEDYLKL